MSVIGNFLPPARVRHFSERPPSGAYASQSHLRSPASLDTDCDAEASAVVAYKSIVDAQEKRPCFGHIERFALTDKEQRSGH
jgi:hypothetical protein